MHPHKFDKDSYAYTVYVVAFENTEYESRMRHERYKIFKLCLFFITVSPIIIFKNTI